MEPLTLLEGVREISRLANPQWPEEVTQRAFDGARVQSEKYAALPDARRLTEVLGLPWRTITELAQEPVEKHAFLLGRKTIWREQDWLTVEYIGFLLKWVAHRLGVSTLTRAQYQAERERILAERKGCGTGLLLPNVEQIETALAQDESREGCWERALYHAELVRSARGVQHTEYRAAPRIEVIERFYTHYGVQPSHENLLDFARGNGIPMSAEGKRPWPESIREWKARREAQGLPVPKKAPNRKVADYSLDVGAALPGETLRPKWSEEDLVVWVARYLEDLKAGERSTQRGYAAWRLGQAGAPMLSTLIKRGGWEHYRRLAAERLLNGATGAGEAK